MDVNKPLVLDHGVRVLVRLVVAVCRPRTEQPHKTNKQQTTTQKQNVKSTISNKQHHIIQDHTKQKQSQICSILVCYGQQRALSQQPHAVVSSLHPPESRFAAVADAAAAAAAAVAAVVLLLYVCASPRVSASAAPWTVAGRSATLLLPLLC